MKTIVVDIPLKGRGIRAQDFIHQGETIERCELVFLNPHDVQGNLEAYVYQYSPRSLVIALGNGSLYNHSDEPNAEFYFNRKRKQLIIRALRSIRPGEEVSIDYGYSPQDKKRFHLQ
jgi:uncharacterized protein